MYADFWSHISYISSIYNKRVHEFSLVNPANLAIVVESIRDMLDCSNLRSFFLRAASATANLMDVDLGIDENTSRPTFRVSEGSYNTSGVTALHGPVTKLLVRARGPSGGQAKPRRSRRCCGPARS